MERICLLKMETTDKNFMFREEKLFLKFVIVTFYIYWVIQITHTICMDWDSQRESYVCAYVFRMSNNILFCNIFLAEFKILSLAEYSSGSLLYKVCEIRKIFLNSCFRFDCNLAKDSSNCQICRISFWRSVAKPLIFFSLTKIYIFILNN